MSFYNFKCRVMRLINEASKKGGRIAVRFAADDEGKFYAFADGITIVGNKYSKRVAVKWGSDHTALAKI